MKIDIIQVACVLLFGMLCVATTSPVSTSNDEDDKEVRKQELFLLANLLHPEKAVLTQDDITKGAMMDKRQGAWDMDYGWGGGRFGKRADMLDYGWGGGRFGKRGDSQMLDYGWGGGRFGKRSGDMLDYGWGGGRFGKRSVNDKQKSAYHRYNTARRNDREK